MTKSELVSLFHASNDKYHRRWSTRTDLMGRAFICLRVGDKYTRFWQLDGLLPVAKSWKRSRIDWYAIREPFEDWMTLWRFSDGVEAVVEKDNRIESVFRNEFAFDGGFCLRPCEQEPPVIHL